MGNKQTIGMISLGCSKNQVDAERMLALLRAAGFNIGTDIAGCDAVIVNTCGFIEDAKRESIEAILECAAEKGNGSLRAVVVTGCLAERYREELAGEMPEADVVLGIGSNAAIAEVVRRALEGERVLSFGEKSALPLEGERILANAPYYAYLKVAEGCDNRCSYCAIPGIRGAFRSRTIESVLQEAKTLADMGVTELNVVAQDTTRYGEDIYGRLMLPELLKKLCAIQALRWVRVLYCYPQRITDELLEVMEQEPKIVKYMDIPVQHASGKVLQAMNRGGDFAELLALVRRIRKKIPDAALRTTLITGFPGEGEEEFRELCEFVAEARFDRLGCFAYSQEEDTPAALFENQVDEDIKRRRADIIMQMQLEIAAEQGQKQIGRTLLVLCEGYDNAEKQYFGRSAMDAPDIDTKVYFTSAGPVKPGEYGNVCIRDALDYDLYGVWANI